MRLTSSIMIWELDTIDICLNDTRELANHLRYLSSTDVFSLPAECITKSVEEEPATILGSA